MKWLHVIAFILVIVGALNWGLIGLFNFDLVNTLLGSAPSMQKIVYILVGVSAVYLLVIHRNECEVCLQKGKKK